MIAAMVSDTLAPPAASPALIRIALRVADPLRRRQLERALGEAVGPEAEADVLLLHLAPGQTLPADAASFDGVLLVLSDDRAIAADLALPGVLPASASVAQILAAVAAVAEGLLVRVPTAPDRAGFAPPDPGSRPLLTPRELEVLALVGEGMSNKTIARKLGISAHTVKYHLEAVFTKLAVRSRAEAVTRGLRAGLIVV
jgi:DNA-binding CsgD family transcriptional regulator